MTERHGDRPDRPESEPAPVITSKARTARWVETQNFSAVERDEDGNQTREGSVRYSRPTDAPSPCVTTQTRLWRYRDSDTRIAYRSTPMDNSAQRDLDERAPTVMRGHETPRWIRTNGENGQGGNVPRSVDDPSPTIVGTFRPTWLTERPATTVQADPRIASPGHRDREGGERQFDEQSVRVTYTEAAILQSFRPDYPWQGSNTKKFQQIGNAIPPLLATAVLGHLLGIDAWRGICRDWYRTDTDLGDYYDAVPEGYYIVNDLDYGEILVPNRPTA